MQEIMIILIVNDIIFINLKLLNSILTVSQHKKEILM